MSIGAVLGLVAEGSDVECTTFSKGGLQAAPG